MIKGKGIKHNIEELFLALISELAQEDDIELVYLFGSYGRGEQRTLSDIDIAILLKPGDADYYFSRKLNLLNKITGLLKTDEVDLVILNEAPPVLKYHVLRGGKALFIRDEEVQRSFREKAVLEYFDLRPLLDVHYRALTARIKEGSFGE